MYKIYKEESAVWPEICKSIVSEAKKWLNRESVQMLLSWPLFYPYVKLGDLKHFCCLLFWIWCNGDIDLWQQVTPSISCLTDWLTIRAQNFSHIAWTWVYCLVTCWVLSMVLSLKIPCHDINHNYYWQRIALGYSCVNVLQPHPNINQVAVIKKSSFLLAYTAKCLKGKTYDPF